MNETDLAAIPIVASIAPLATSTDAWLVDIWGVMHNGVRPFESAVAACEEFRARGGSVLLLSNAPRPAASVATQLDRIGVRATAWDEIVTSGDAARAMISAHAGEALYHLGPERDLPIYDGLGVTLTEPAQAAAVVCTGLFDDETETPDDYAAILTDLHARGLAMICANPDLKVERGGRIVWCAGGVAAAYQALGGKVTYAGKPHLPVYALATARIAALRGAPVPQDRILAIGDGVKTDIAGAARAGIRSVFVASAIHVDPRNGLDASAVSALFDELPSRPVAAMTSLAW